MSLDLNSYGIIGDMRTCALVSDKGSIDWLCMPRFDSEAVLLRLLDDQRGGFCDIQLTGFTGSTRRYLLGTNILETFCKVKPVRFASMTSFPFVKVTQEKSMPSRTHNAFD